MGVHKTHAEHSKNDFFNFKNLISLVSVTNNYERTIIIKFRVSNDGVFVDRAKFLGFMFLNALL